MIKLNNIVDLYQEEVVKGIIISNLKLGDVSLIM